MAAQHHLFSLLFAVSASITCAADTAVPANIDKAFAEYVALPDVLLPIMEEVQDKTTADAAAEKLYAALPKVYDTRSELQKIATLPPEVTEQLKQKYEKDMRTRWGKVYDHIFRLQKVRCYDSLSFFKQFHTLCMMLDQ